MREKDVLKEQQKAMLHVYSKRSTATTFNMRPNLIVAEHLATSKLTLSVFDAKITTQRELSKPKLCLTIYLGFLFGWFFPYCRASHYQNPFIS